MIKLLWNTQNQNTSVTNKQSYDNITDKGWGIYHKVNSDKWIFNILKRVQFKSIKNVAELENEDVLIIIDSSIEKKNELGPEKNEFNLVSIDDFVKYAVYLMDGKKFNRRNTLLAIYAAFSLAKDEDLMNKRVPFYAADAGRWAGEMDEISKTFSLAGVSGNLHRGAADIFRLLDASPLSSETRETIDQSRSLDEAIQIYADTVGRIRLHDKDS